MGVSARFDAQMTSWRSKGAGRFQTCVFQKLLGLYGHKLVADIATHIKTLPGGLGQRNGSCRLRIRLQGGASSKSAGISGCDIFMPHITTFRIRRHAPLTRAPSIRPNRNVRLDA